MDCAVTPCHSAQSLPLTAILQFSAPKVFPVQKLPPKYNVYISKETLVPLPTSLSISILP